MSRSSKVLVSAKKLFLDRKIFFEFDDEWRIREKIGQK